MADLKPCPVCGTAPTLGHFELLWIDGYLYICPECGHGGKFKDSLSEAVEEWNKNA